MIKAVLLGSIGVLAETSELQRKAFNQAFAENELDWHWDQDIYQIMLEESGGQERIEKYAQSQGFRVVDHHEVAEEEEIDEDMSDEEIAAIKEARAEEEAKPELDGAALHHRKTEIFIEMLGESALKLRPGVKDIIVAAQEKGVPVGFVTSTNKDVVDAVLAAVADDLPEDAFQVVTSFDDVDLSKPSSEAYQKALHELDLTINGVVAIEDNVDGVLAAEKSNLKVIAFPGDNTKDHDYGETKVVDKLTVDLVFPE